MRYNFGYIYTLGDETPTGQDQIDYGDTNSVLEQVKIFVHAKPPQFWDGVEPCVVVGTYFEDADNHGAVRFTYPELDLLYGNVSAKA